LTQWLVGELAPCVAAVVDDVLVRLEDPVRESILAQEVPDVFGRVEPRCAHWQGQERDVLGQLEFGGGVPSGTVEDG